MTKLPRAVLIMGPTGAGKTDLAIELATNLPLEIISVDSAMVYRGLDIGSGKPARDVLAQIPHHLIDVLDPAQRYSAGQFLRDARRLIREIGARGRIPLLVGGTMLYFRALTRGLAELPEANAAVRAEIDARAAVTGWPALHSELARVDPDAARRIQPHDTQRIQRALEVYRLTGRSLTELHSATPAAAAQLDCLRLVWCPAQRPTLYERIEARFRMMMRVGLLDEVAGLFGRGDLDCGLPSMRSVGYRQLWAHLAGELELEVAVARAILATRHLARRQLTWLRAEADVEWVDALDSGAAALMQARIAEFMSCNVL